MALPPWLGFLASEAPLAGESRITDNLAFLSYTDTGRDGDTAAI